MRIMVIYGLLCSLGIRGGLMLGFATAELLLSYWKSRYNESPSPRVYIFGRRIHHGEIGTLLALSSLFFGRTSISMPATILTGIGLQLVMDDYADFSEWFRLKKKDAFQRPRAGALLDQKKEPIIEHINNNNNNEVIPSFLCRNESISNAKKTSKNNILESLRKQIRSIIEEQTQSIKCIELQIQQSRKHLLLIERNLS
jgi:hypothetical protein